MKKIPDRRTLCYGNGDQGAFVDESKVDRMGRFKGYGEALQERLRVLRRVSRELRGASVGLEGVPEESGAFQGGLGKLQEIPEGFLGCLEVSRAIQEISGSMRRS